jgi:hypothetical protein
MVPVTWCQLQVEASHHLVEVQRTDTLCMHMLVQSSAAAVSKPVQHAACLQAREQHSRVHNDCVAATITPAIVLLVSKITYRVIPV